MLSLPLFVMDLCPCTAIFVIPRDSGESRRLSRRSRIPAQKSPSANTLPNFDEWEKLCPCRWVEGGRMGSIFEPVVSHEEPDVSKV